MIFLLFLCVCVCVLVVVFVIIILFCFWLAARNPLKLEFLFRFVTAFCHVFVSLC